MPGLDPGIHGFFRGGDNRFEDVDGRVKPVYDEERVWGGTMRILIAASLVALAASAAAQATDIPVVLSLSGPAAFLGQQEQQAIQLKEKVLNQAGGIHGKPVRFVFHDDASSPQTAVQLTQDVLQSKPRIVLGSTLTATCNAMAPLFANGPIMYCFSALIDPKPGYVFASSVSADDMAEAEV